MTAIAAEEVQAKRHRELPAANTPPTSPSKASFPSASGRDELLVAWTDLLVGVITQKEATA